MLECKKLGLDVSGIAPAKLKSGHGEDTCTLLLKLAEASLKSKFRFKKPVIREEGALDDEADEMGDEIKVTVIAAGFERWDAGPGLGARRASSGVDPRPSSARDIFADLDGDPLDDDDDGFDVPSFLK